MASEVEDSGGAPRAEVDDVSLERNRDLIRLSLPANLPTLSAHLLPCRILKSGAASVSTFFQPVPGDEPGTKQAWFRGRELSAVTVQCPDDMRGFIVSEGENGFGATHSLASFDLWNRDKNAHERDVIKRTVEEWPTIARGIHDPV